MIIQLDGEHITLYDDQTTNQPCPQCGTKLKARVESNHAPGISLFCPTPRKECAYSRFVYYTQMHNFPEVVADRIIGEVDFDEMHYSRNEQELSSDYLLTPDGLWRAWGYPRQFQEVPIGELPDVDPVDIAVRRYLNWNDSWGSAFEEYFDAFPGPYWTLRDRLPREAWLRVSDLFVKAENDNGRYQWYTRSPREVVQRLIDAGVWEGPSEKDIQAEARRQAKDEAIRQHREQIRKQFEEWLSEQQKAYEVWVEEVLGDLVRTTVYPRPDDEHIVWRKHWHKDLDGTWYTTGGSYIGVQHPQDGEYIVHHYGNASAAYATEEQANRWYEQKWKETKTPGMALDLLTTWLEGGHVYGGDFAMWACEHHQEDVLSLARAGEVEAQYGAAYAYALASKFYRIPIRVVRKTFDSEEIYYGYGDPQGDGATAWVDFGEEDNADWPTAADIAAEQEDSARSSSLFSALFT